MPYEVKVIADSISETGKRLTTIEARYPRFVHSEFMTHRVMSRNASSSRAVPIEKMIASVIDGPVLPVEWGKNQSGMQAKVELQGAEKTAAINAWLDARDDAVRNARIMVKHGVHKQIVNRLLEPFSWITTLISATEWDNFFALRCHPDAQPEMRKLAEMIRDARNQSTPQKFKLEYRDWAHLPYVTKDEKSNYTSDGCAIISVARCARVSYLRQGEQPDFDKDKDLHDKLRESGHWSPFEHVARPAFVGSGNFIGWKQYRHDFGC